MIFPIKFLGCPLFLGYICWPKVVGALLLLSAPLPYFLSGIPGCLLMFKICSSKTFRQGLILSLPFPSYHSTATAISDNSYYIKESISHYGFTAPRLTLPSKKLCPCSSILLETPCSTSFPLPKLRLCLCH